jgi:hypothetical protein
VYSGRRATVITRRRKSATVSLSDPERTIANVKTLTRGKKDEDRENNGEGGEEAEESRLSGKN